MTWTIEQEKQKWLDTKAGEFLKKSDIQERMYNAIMRHFIFQYNPHSGSIYPWKMKGTIKELELIAKGELPIAGIGDKSRKDLQEVLDNDKSTK